MTSSRIFSVVAEKMDRESEQRINCDFVSELAASSQNSVAVAVSARQLPELILTQK